MDTSTEEEVRKRVEALPPAIKALLYSPEMLNTLTQVGSRHQLHIDQVGFLEAETSEVMLGYTQTADFPAALSESLGVDGEKAKAIAKDIDETLFAKIREEMKSGYEQSKKEVGSIPSNPPAVSAPVVPVSAHLADLSVVMPSSVAKAPTAPESTFTAPVVPPAPAKQIEPPAMAHIDAMLSQPTVSVAPVAPTAPATPTTPAAPAAKAPEAAKATPPTPDPLYKKTDPYHEPID